jgi:hypothetical protein
MPKVENFGHFDADSRVRPILVPFHLPPFIREFNIV